MNNGKAAARDRMPAKIRHGWIVALLLVLCGTGVFAQTEADFEVRLTSDGEGLVILAYTGRAAQIQIPAVIRGIPVREIGDGEDPVTGPEVTGIVIPPGVTKINSQAFAHCSSLTTVTLPADLQTIGGYAFVRCTSLTAVILPAGLQTIGEGTFDDCFSLTTVTFPAGLQIIGDYAFVRCTSLTAVTLPAGLQTIGEYAFESCTSLTAVTLPAGLQTIGEYAFAHCSSLAAVALPAGLQTIGEGAFLACSSLTVVTYPDTIQITGLPWWGTAEVFRDCPRLSPASRAAIKKLDEIAEANRERAEPGKE
ncbi:MAG: leucine-rich repeat domain-containing protein [Treponema sp.]|jgi:hypothetical protein|nr:leucine-rich repeat domain-containing protein [Treponema sp.]